MTERRLADSPPSKLPRLSGADAYDGTVTVAAPATAPLVLGLGLGVGGSRSDSSGSDASEASATTAVTRPSPLTFMQRQELEHQVLIYRYFAAGAPVPVHLVLPIWKSVAASSFGPHRFPSLVGLGSLCFDYRSSMEPEPGRCRRTDGKKWRCSRDVVQGHKYCERHVHRGRSRSRKPVEGVSASAGAAAAAPAHNAGITAPPRGLGFSPAASVLHAATQSAAATRAT